MATHEVKVTLPEREIQRAAVTFTVKNGNGQAGTLCISQGGVQWLAAYGKRWTHLTWEQFAAKMAE